MSVAVTPFCVRDMTRASVHRCTRLVAVVACVLFAGLAAATDAESHRPCERTPMAVMDLYFAPAKPSAPPGGTATIDPVIEKPVANPAEVVARFVERVASEADWGWAPVRPDVSARHIHCAATWLASWARDGALLGVMRSRQAEIKREFDLSGLALAYLKVRGKVEPDDRKLIEGWLVRLADAVAAIHEKQQPRSRRYWIGLAYGAVGLATDSERHWMRARTILNEALGDIGPKGLLKTAIRRKERALHYHVQAVTPLVVLAALAISRGETPYATGDGALHRLVGLVVAAHKDSASFAKLVGTAQQTPAAPGAGWLTVYASRFPERANAEELAVETSHRWLGGDTRVLLKALAPAS